MYTPSYFAARDDTRKQVALAHTLAPLLRDRTRTTHTMQAAHVVRFYPALRFCLNAELSKEGNCREEFFSNVTVYTKSFYNSSVLKRSRFFSSSLEFGSGVASRLPSLRSALSQTKKHHSSHANPFFPPFSFTNKHKPLWSPGLLKPRSHRAPHPRFLSGFYSQKNSNCCPGWRLPPI